jgi:hypothetical protein
MVVVINPSEGKPSMGKSARAGLYASSTRTAFSSSAISSAVGAVANSRKPGVALSRRGSRARRVVGGLLRRIASVDKKRMAGHERRIIGRKVERGSRHLLRSPDTPKRMLRSKIGLRLFGVRLGAKPVVI